MTKFFIAGLATFVGLFILGPIIAALCRTLGFYTIVQERQCKVYVLFGKVALIINEPGLHFLWLKLGWKAPIIGWLGRCHVLDLRLDQEYLRSQPVNSEEGAPMDSARKLRNRTWLRFAGTVGNSAAISAVVRRWDW